MIDIHDRPVSILLVEDDEEDYIITRNLLSELEGSKFNLDWTASYDAALEEIRLDHHDVYILDYYLGQHDGLELLNEAVLCGCKGPVIMLSGLGERSVDLEAMKAGAADYLVKGRLDALVLERSIRYAIERAHMLDSLRALATRDELTGLYNRREMDRILGEEIDRYRRYGDPVSMVILDIDHFKGINDTYGHMAGDDVLRSLSRFVDSKLRSTDRAVRYGGEELALILPKTRADEAFQVAERLRRAVEAQPFGFTLRSGQPAQVSVTISLGVAAIPGDANNIQSLVSAADWALYQAKRWGRNRTTAFSNGALITVPLTLPLLLKGPESEG